MNIHHPHSVDFIGDIHGHANELKLLLEKLGYTNVSSFYSHPTRKVLFVGDYIDRGPQIPETLAIVKSMVDNNQAIALMGNHEYNAICFHYLDPNGGHLRQHNITNVMQHYETLKQFQNKQQQYNDYIEWLKTLPLFYETESFRAVHSCWDNNHISYLRSVLQNDRLTDELIHASIIEDKPLFNAIEETLKGKEMPMPTGIDFKDKDGAIRTDFRIRWWEDPQACTYRNMSVHSMEILPNTLIESSGIKHPHFYAAADKPVFFGHYWLNGNPMLFKNNVCCLDYSVAKQGKLVAYRFNGEKELDNGNIVYV